MKFFTFTQNNTHGTWHINHSKAIGHYVIVQADNAEEANRFAESIGLYFDGVLSGIDCNCCGNRWHTVDDEDGTDEPKVYDEVQSYDKNNHGAVVLRTYSSKYEIDSIVFIHFKESSSHIEPIKEEPKEKKNDNWLKRNFNNLSSGTKEFLDNLQQSFF